MSSDQARALWERGWEGHERHQRERLSSLPFSEKLQWLEEAHRLVLHLSRVAQTPPGRPDEESEG